MAASPCGEKARRLRDCVDSELGRAQLCLCQGGERGGVFVEINNYNLLTLFV